MIGKGDFNLQNTHGRINNDSEGEKTLHSRDNITWTNLRADTEKMGLQHDIMVTIKQVVLEIFVCQICIHTAIKIELFADSR